MSNASDSQKPGDPGARAWFLWSEPTTWAEFRTALDQADGAERSRLLGTLMREAPDPVVWQFTTVSEVRARFADIER